VKERGRQGRVRAVRQMHARVDFCLMLSDRPLLTLSEAGVSTGALKRQMPWYALARRHARCARVRARLAEAGAAVFRYYADAAFR